MFRETAANALCPCRKRHRVRCCKYPAFLNIQQQVELPVEYPASNSRLPDEYPAEIAGSFGIPADSSRLVEIKKVGSGRISFSWPATLNIRLPVAGYLLRSTLPTITG